MEKDSSPASAVLAGTGHADKFPVADPNPVFGNHFPAAGTWDGCEDLFPHGNLRFDFLRNEQFIKKES
jgi:hypothetical protein